MTQDLFSLDGKRALVTGSSRGLGFVIARGLAEAGAAVTLHGRSTETLERAAAELKSLDTVRGEIHVSSFDILDKEAVDAAIGRIEREAGAVDVLVNNAGVQIRGPLEEFDLDDWRTVLDTNLTGAYVVSARVVKAMKAAGSGKIINMCSLQSELGRATIAPYTASNGGLKMLTKAMATEWGSHDIQVNGSGPGYFVTDMTRALAEDPEFDGWLRGRTPAGRWGDPHELVGTAIYLASAASSFVNGQIIYVDGGVLASL